MEGVKWLKAFAKRIDEGTRVEHIDGGRYWFVQVYFWLIIILTLVGLTAWAVKAVTGQS